MKIFFIIFAVLFFVNAFCMYLVKDYRNGIQYKGVVGRIQNLIKH
jgi:hypothetical protein